MKKPTGQEREVGLYSMIQYTIQYIHPDTLVGDSCIQCIPLEADELNAEEIILAQLIEFPGMWENSTNTESNFEVSKVYCIQSNHPQHFQQTTHD